MKKENNLFLVLVLCIILSVASYYLGSRNESNSSSDHKKQLQHQIDSLTICNELKTLQHEKLQDSLRNDNRSHESSIKMINEVKTLIRNEIAKTKQSTFDLPDSAVQYHIDSIRSAGGFKAN